MPDEVTSIVCSYSKNEANPVSEGLTQLDACPDLYEAMIFASEDRASVHTTLLSLRLVCKKLYRTATPYIWEVIDLQPKPHSPNKLVDRGRSRDSLGVLELIASRPDIARHVRTMRIRVDPYLESLYSKPVELGREELRIEELIRAALSAIPALRTFDVDSDNVLFWSPFDLLLLSRSLRLFVDPDADDCYRLKSKQAVERLPPLLEAYKSHWSFRTMQLLAQQTTMKRLMIRSLPTLGMDPNKRTEAELMKLDVSWASAIEELNLIDWTGDAAPSLTAIFQVFVAMFVQCAR